MRVHKIRSAVQVAVDWAFGFTPAKTAVKALDAACSPSEMSGIMPIASAIRLLVYYAGIGGIGLDKEAQIRRDEDLRKGVKRLAGVILGHVAPSETQPPSDETANDMAQAPDFKKMAAGDND